MYKLLTKEEMIDLIFKRHHVRMSAIDFTEMVKDGKIVPKETIDGIEYFDPAEKHEYVTF